jgi:hypothetical protein
VLLQPASNMASAIHRNVCVRNTSVSSLQKELYAQCNGQCSDDDTAAAASHPSKFAVWR